VDPVSENNNPVYTSEMIGAMTIIGYSDGEEPTYPCFTDVAHALSHVAFFTDYYKLKTKFDITGASGECHSIVTNSNNEAMVQLTQKGQVRLDAVCKATTAFGRCRYPSDMSGMQVTMPAPLDEATEKGEARLPTCQLYKATAGVGSTNAAGLDKETNFARVEVADEPAVLASSVPVAFEAKASSAIIALFMRSSLSEIDNLPEQIESKHVQRLLTQPNVNTRSVTEMTRLYDEARIGEDELESSDDAGLVETAQGKGKRGNNFIGQDYYVVPYSICKSEKAPKGSAEVFSAEVAMGLWTTLEGRPKAKIATVDEVESLWDLLFPGRTAARPDFVNKAGGSDEAHAARVFSQLLGTMEEVFGGLNTEEEWADLCLRLCNCDQLRDYNLGRVMVNLPWPEINFFVHHMMGAVSPLGVAILDGLGRICATKLASINRYPSTTYSELNHPHLSYSGQPIVDRNAFDLDYANPPAFGVIGQQGVVKVISINQSPILGKASLAMCRAFSEGILSRVTQVTTPGLQDFVHGFLNQAPLKRDKFCIGVTEEEMTDSFHVLREEAYSLILNDSTSNRHLVKIHELELEKRGMAVADFRLHCTKVRLGVQKNSGLAEPNSMREGYRLITWLVHIMTNSFFFATKARTNSGDSSYDQMLILSRNNGNRGLLRLPPNKKNPFDEKDNLYSGVAANFKVCQTISH
jgi:hypothetical protein